MSIRIICKKIPNIINNPGKQIKLLTSFYDYNDELTNNVKKFNGFISSESYYNSNICEYSNNNIDSILTLSHWKSHINWNEWFNSKERQNIYNKIFKYN